MEIKISQAQWIGIGGVIASFIGMFAPLYSALTIDVSLMSTGQGAAIFGVALGAAAAAIVMRKGRVALVAGVVALGVIVVLFVRYQNARAKFNDLTSEPTGIEWADALAEGLGEMAQASLSPQWGWAVLVVGIVAVLFSSFNLIWADRVGRAERRADDAPTAPHREGRVHHMPLTWDEAAHHVLELPRVAESEADGQRILTVDGIEFARDEGTTILVASSSWEGREMVRSLDPAVSIGPTIDGLAHVRIDLDEAADDPQIVELLVEARRIAENHSHGPASDPA